MNDRSTVESIKFFSGFLPDRIEAMNKTLAALPDSGELTTEQECELILKVGDVESILCSIMGRISDEA